MPLRRNLKNPFISALVVSLLLLTTPAFAQKPANAALAAKYKQAETMFDAAIELANQDTAESMRAAIPKLKKVRQLLKETNSRQDEANCLGWLGDIASALGDNQSALKFYNESLPLLRAVGDKRGEATTLSNIGLVYSDSGDNQNALKLYNESLLLRRLIADKRGEATTLSNIGAVYSELGDNQSALKFFNESLPLRRLVGDKNGEAATLSNIGAVYSELSDKQSALKYFNEALPLRRLVGDKSGEATTLSNIGKVYSDLGDNQQALKFYNEALPLSRLVGDKSGEATTLTNIGKVYSDLSDNQSALKFYNEALPLLRAVQDKRTEAATLNNIGGVYSDLGDKQNALKYYNQSLPLVRAVGDKGGEAATLNNIGAVYSDLSDKQSALKLYNEALPLFRAVGDKGGEAATLSNIGGVYSALGETAKALEYFQAALPLSKLVGDKEGQAITLDWLMDYWNKQKNPRFAVFYGKQSVNLLQEMRSNIATLDKELQKTYLKSIEYVYRRLANVLIAQGRIAEAEAVLAMLKQDEYFDFVRRDDKVAAELKEKLTLTTDETAAFARYAELADNITALGKELDELERESKNFPVGQFPKQIRRDELRKAVTDANMVFSKYLESLSAKFKTPAGNDDLRVALISSTKALLNKLNQPRTVIISTIAGEDRLNLIVTTAKINRAHRVEIKAAELNKLVSEFRAAVKNPNLDPRPSGKKLFDVLFPADLQKDLANVDADTIVWSLDGTLRYVPIAALWDGEKYLVERWSNAVITLASRDKIETTMADRSKWLALGVGVSKAAVVKNADGTTTSFDSLSAVPEELCRVVNDKTSGCAGLQKGVIAGTSLLDDKFTLDVFEEYLGRFPVVHIASHFSLRAGNESDSYLLLGGGERKLTLADVRNRLDTKFVGVDLLTLSACNTAMGANNEGNGREIEGFGALAQDLGAKTVLATLWSVADSSTRDLMSDFYTTLETDSKLGKADALRNAQLKMLQGKYKPTETAAWRKRGIGLDEGADKAPTFKSDANAPFAHPYFWSPFILFGNWK